MFSIYRSQKNIQNKVVDYKALYLQEKKLKEQYQRKAQIAQLKYRKLAQSINKKCVRCMNIGQRKTKQDRIVQLKQFQNGLNLLNIGNIADIPKNQRVGKLKIIQNFGVFGIPQSMLIQPEHFDDLIEGQLLFASNMPTVAQEHAAKLAFPSGVVPQYYSGIEAKQKAIQIMSSSTSFAKSFIMSFENKNLDDQQKQCQVKKLMNPQNRLYAICLTMQDFSMIPNWQTDLIQSQKMVIPDKIDPTSIKVLSCQQTDISYHCQNQCSIATSPRVYCIFSQYPFFYFYQQVLKAIVNSVKTQRLVIYRESGCILAEADSHFFLQRVKQTYRQIANQIDNWQIKLTRQYELKLLSCQKIPLSLNPQVCMMNFVQDWGLSIFNMFNVDTFIDVFTLIMLEEKVVFVTDNPTILTFTVHLFAQLLPRPFKYPFPVVNLLPENQGYFQTLCPFVYGYLNSKKNLMGNKITERFSNIFVFLQKQGIQIISSQSTKNTLKKRPKVLRDTLSLKFKPTNQRNRRVSNLTFAQQQINFQKDKQGICSQIIKQVNLYLNEQIMKNLPTSQQVEQTICQLLKNMKQGQDIHQLAFQKIKKNYQNKSKDQFYKALMETQIVNTYLFK